MSDTHLFAFGHRPFSIRSQNFPKPSFRFVCLFVWLFELDPKCRLHARKQITQMDFDYLFSITRQLERCSTFFPPGMFACISIVDSPQTKHIEPMLLTHPLLLGLPFHLLLVIFPFILSKMRLIYLEHKISIVTNTDWL